MPGQVFRFYEEDVPAVKSVVLVKVTHVDEDTGAHVILLEYGAIAGLIPVSAVSKRRIRSLTQLVGVGMEVVAQVENVEENHITLSMAVVMEDEGKNHKARFRRRLRFNNRITSFILRTGVEPMSVYLPLWAALREDHQQHLGDADRRGDYDLLHLNKDCATYVAYTKRRMAACPTCPHAHRGWDQPRERKRHPNGTRSRCMHDDIYPFITTVF